MQAAAIPAAACLKAPIRRLPVRQLHRTPGLLDLLDRRLGGAGDVERQLGFELAVRQQPHAILGAADDAGRDQRLGVDRRLGVELLGVDRRLHAGSDTTLNFLAKMFLKPRLGRRR